MDSTPSRANSTRLSVEDMRAALDKLLADPQFHASERNRRFLRHVTEEMLAGRSDRIKSYSIAMDVFGRGADFDPETDPVVRIEATRLRSALVSYYDGKGRQEPIRIRLPRGGYVPVFEEAETNVPVSPEPRPIEQSPKSTPQWRLGGGLLIAALIVAVAAGALLLPSAPPEQSPVITSPPYILVEATSAGVDPDKEAEQIASGFAQSLLQSLSRFDGLRVVGVPKDLPLSSALERLQEKSPAAASYALDSSVRRVNDTLRFWWLLKDARDGETVWSATIERPLSGSMTTAVEDEVATKLAAVIGQPSGMVANREIATERVRPTDGYGCVLRAHAYYHAFSEALHREVRDCLEKTVALAPDYAEAWAMLGFIYLDESRHKLNPRTTGGDGLTRGLAAAHRAAELSPYSELAQEALLATLYFKGDFDDAFAAGRRAIEINPHNPELRLALGTRLFARGNWDERAKLVEDAMNESLVASSIDRSTLAMNLYRKGDYHGALKQAELINPPGFYGGPMIRAAIYGELGDSVKATENVSALLALRPQYAAEMRSELRARHYTEPLIDLVADGLRKAGLKVE